MKTKITHFPRLIAILTVWLAVLLIASNVYADNSPLCFTAKGGSVTVRFEIKNVTHTIQYSTNGTSWSNYTSNKNVTLNANQSIYFRAASNQTTAKAFGSGEQMQYTGSRFYFTSSNNGTVEASGNIMSLYGPDCPNLSLPPKAFAGMFSDCNLLTTAPLLPATNLGWDCYNSMFYMCTSLVSAPVLPAKRMARTCYENMFRGCTSLQNAPELPALDLAYGCYDNMFYNCTSLTIAPELPATTLQGVCYGSMFFNCYSLKEPPVLPATSLPDLCYAYMFKNCTSMVINKVGPGKPWKITTSSSSDNYGLRQMFTGTGGTMNGTPSLNVTYYVASTMYNVKAICNDKNKGSVTGSGQYAYGDTAILVATPKSNAYFVKWSNGSTSKTIRVIVTKDTTLTAFFDYDEFSVTATSNNNERGYVEGNVGIHKYGDTINLVAIARDGYMFDSWSNGSKKETLKFAVTSDTILTANFYSSDYLCLTAVDGPAAITININGNSSLFSSLANVQTSVNSRKNWSSSKNATTINLNEGDSLFLKYGYILSRTKSNYVNFQMTGKVAASGNVMSLIDGRLEKDTAPKYAFYKLFENCTSLIVAPKLPAIALSTSCYERMFANCTDLTESPEISARTIAKRSCYEMFNGCYSLTTLPDLYSTTLADSCYYRMFAGCDSLVINTDAPGYAWQIPSNTITAQLWNEQMFAGTSGTFTGNPQTGVKYYVYKPVNYTLSLVSNNDEWGSVMGGGPFLYGDSVEIKAIPAANCYFKGWSNGTSDSVTKVVVTKDLQLVANFQKITYDISPTCQNINNGIVNGYGTYYIGDSVTLTAIPAPECKFLCWSDGTTDSIIHLYVDGNILIDAIFIPNTEPLVEPISLPYCYQESTNLYFIDTLGIVSVINKEDLTFEQSSKPIYVVLPLVDPYDPANINNDWILSIEANLEGSSIFSLNKDINIGLLESLYDLTSFESIKTIEITKNVSSETVDIPASRHHGCKFVALQLQRGSALLASKIKISTLCVERKYECGVGTPIVRMTNNVAEISNSEQNISEYPRLTGNIMSWQQVGDEWYILNVDDRIKGSTEYVKNYNVYLPNAICINSTYEVRNETSSTLTTHGFNFSLFCDGMNLYRFTNVRDKIYSTHFTLQGYGRTAILSNSIEKSSDGGIFDFLMTQSNYARISIPVPQHYDMKNYIVPVEFGNVKIGSKAYIDIPLERLFTSFKTESGLQIEPAVGNPSSVFSIGTAEYSSVVELVPANTVYSPYNDLSANTNLIQYPSGAYALRINFNPIESQSYHTSFYLKDASNTIAVINVTGEGVEVVDTNKIKIPAQEPWDIQYKKSEDVNWINDRDYGYTNYEIKNLEPNTYYVVRIRNHCSSGYSDWSKEIFFKTGDSIYYVTAKANNVSMGNVTGSGSYSYGDTAILTATANPHCRFVNWSNGMTTPTIHICVLGDSILTANFVANPTYIFPETHSMCQGETYTWRGKQLTMEGVYYDSLKTVLEEDSVYELTLIVNPKYLIEDTIYTFSFPYSWHGRDIVSSGVYYDSLTTEGAGCDSIYKLTVIDSPKPLCFTAKGGSVTVRFDIKNVTHTIQYSTDGASWSNYTSNTNVTLSVNQSIYFRAASNQTIATAFSTYGDSSDSRFYFSSTDGGMVEASGNIMSLYGPDCPNLQLQRYAFQRMFSECSLLTTAPSLPATNLADGCYRGMFSGCISLTTAPSLPATNLANECYSAMFYECTSLTTAPSLSATNLAVRCYMDMFDGCTSLITAPSLPATNLAVQCYMGMFSGCSSMTTAPSLPATNLAYDCYAHMFSFCTSLTTAPSLPATNLADHCYYYMFYSCTSLTTAPSLPATNLAKECYYMMFNGCTSLTTAPSLPATNLADRCYLMMFSNCISLTTAPSLPATNLADRCYLMMFYGCRSLTTAPSLPATNLADHCYNRMFGSCRSLTTAPSLPATNLANHCYEEMFSGCTSLTTVPLLQATTLADSCYLKMFSGCTSLIVNTTGPGKQWKIPAATIDGLDNPVTDMFTGTSGTMNGTPSVNTTYYLTSGKYSVTVNVNDSTMGSAFGNGLYKHGDTAILIASANPNYHFVRWSNGMISPTISLEIFGDTTLTAIFEVNQTYFIPETHTICQGETYNWHNKSLTASGIYYDSLKSQYGSDSVYQLTLTVNPTYLIQEAHSICQGETYSWRTRNLSTAGVYYDSLQTVAGCDSVYELTLTVNPTYLFQETHAICQGETYNWRNRSLTNAGVFYDSLKTVAGCDSVYELTLTVNPTYFFPEAYSICQGETYNWRNKSLSVAGVYYDSLNTAVGCDSVYELTLTVNPTYLFQETYSICQGETYTWRGRNLTTSGVFYDSLNTVAGCDSVYELTLTVNPTYFFPETHSICQGDTYSWRGRNLTTTGVYYDSLKTVAGCDSVYELTLTVNPTYFFPETYSICQGETYSWRGRNLTTTGVYYDSLKTVAGCDSVYELTLTVNPTYFIQESYSICQGETYNWRTKNLTTSGVYYDSLLTVAGCDSVYELTLTVNPTYLIPETYSICQGETYSWRGRNLTTSGVYYDSLLTAAGCDSVYELTLTVNPTYFFPETYSICHGETYSWRTKDLTTAGVYYDSLKTTVGCDSVYELTLTVNPTYFFPETYSICQGETYSWRSKNLSTTGVYYDSLKTVAGCDSVYELTLTVNPTYFFPETYSICQGETYNWRSKSLSTAGVYYDSLQTTVGCDSVYELTLTVNPTYLFQETHSICQGETYNWRNKALSVAGVYYDSLQTTVGCDSVYELTLTVNPTYLFQETHAICQGETYSWRTKNLTTTGVYYDSLQTVAGCDSVYELTLTVNPTYLFQETYSICQGETYTWRNKVLSTAGIYYDSLQTQASCDSVYELTLTVNPTYFFPETYSICQGETYSWRTRNLTTTGVYYDSLKTVAGCDSVYELTLTVNPTYFFPETYSICQGETYTWRGRNLTTSGVYYDSLQTVAGCDSVYELTLTVNPTYFFPETYSICQGETYSWRSKNLSTTGVYYDSLKTVAGCDSVYELTLTVNPTYLFQETYSICQGETYNWRNKALSVAGVYYDSLQTTVGCDSVYELTLTVNPTYLFPEAYSICQGETYSWRNRNLTTAGVYYDSLKTVAGCDSVYELTLTVNPTYFFPETYSICQGETYTWRSKNLTTSGVFYDSLKTIAGCDSVYELTLTVNPTYFFPENDVICHGNIYNWHSKAITAAGLYYDSLKTISGCDSIYELTLTYDSYHVAIHQNDANMGDVIGAGSFECGQMIKISASAYECHRFVRWSDGVSDNPRRFILTCDTDFTAEFEVITYNVTVTSNNSNGGKAFCYNNNNETSSIVINCGNTVELHAESFPNYHFVEWSDGNTDSIRSIKVVSDTSLVAMFEPNCGELANWPVVFKYNSLFILNLNEINAMGYNPQPEDVSWYMVVDEPDILDASFSADDQYICNGHYMSLITNNLSYGQYYAVVDVSKNAGVLCHDKMRTEIVEYAYNGQKIHIELAPTNVKGGDVMTVFGLIPDEETTLMVCDYSGKLIEKIKSNGSDKCQITAIGSAGVYMINVVSESVNETLKFIITK